MQRFMAVCRSTEASGQKCRNTGSTARAHRAAKATRAQCGRRSTSSTMLPSSPAMFFVLPLNLWVALASERSNRAACVLGHVPIMHNAKVGIMHSWRRRNPPSQISAMMRREGCFSARPLAPHRYARRRVSDMSEYACWYEYQHAYFAAENPPSQFSAMMRREKQRPEGGGQRPGIRSSERRKRACISKH